MLLVPSIFLFIDFYTPLFYLIFFFFVLFICFKYIFKELTYKFLVDYLAKNSVNKIKNIKFIDLLLNKIISSGFRGFSYIRINTNLYIKSKYFNRLIILIIFIFIIIWGFILI